MATNERRQAAVGKHESQGIAAKVNDVKDSEAAKNVANSAVVQKGVGPLRAFFKKFTNDWTLNLQAGALVYHLVVAIFPILVALFLLFGLILGSLGSNIQKLFTDAVT